VSTPDTSAKKRWAKWASLLILTIASAFFAEELFLHFDEIPAIHWDAAAWLAMVGTVACMLINLSMGGLMWKALLKDQGTAIPTITAIRIVFVSQVGKYLPGNVGHLVGQVGLASAVGVPYTVSITTMLISTLWLAAIGLSLGLLGLVLFFDTAAQSHLPDINTHWVLLVSLLAAASPWLGVWLLNRTWPKLSKALGHGQLVSLPRLMTSVGVGLGFMASFFVMGLMLKWQAVHIFGVNDGNLLALSLLFASAWTAGYLLPGAPGGLGVREAVSIALLTPILGAGTAVALSITMRMSTTLGDGLAFLVGLLIQRFEPAPPLTHQ
jgi:hypothetical protein